MLDSFCDKTKLVCLCSVCVYYLSSWLKLSTEENGNLILLMFCFLCLLLYVFQGRIEFDTGTSLGFVMAIGISVLYSSFVIFLIQEKNSKVYTCRHPTSLTVRSV